jgi:pimeloyl-ACP methyl ester carboxylesterase
MSGQFPPIEPYDSGMLDVGGGHRVYWECCGNPTGRPALFLHGGPGSGCSATQRRFFAARLNGSPGVLIHGRFDVSGPLVTAWRLSQRWTTCRLQILDDAGHGGGSSFVPTVIDALAAFASL